MRAFQSSARSSFSLHFFDLEQSVRRQRFTSVQKKTNQATEKVIADGGIKGSRRQLGLLVSAHLGRLQRGTRAHPSAVLISHPFLFPSTLFEPLSSALLLSSQWLYCARLKSNHHYPFLALPPDLHSISASQAFPLQFSFFFPVALVPPSLLSFFFFFDVWCQVLFQGASCDPCSHTSALLRQALALYYSNERRAEWEKRQTNQRSHFHLVSEKKQIRGTE